MKKNIRIKDIAQMAQVSVGTVDRVLHRRGRVSATAEARVVRVLKEINYRPNVVAKALSKTRSYPIAVLMPHPETDPYWEMSRRGVEEAERQLQAFGVETHNFLFDPYRSVSFQEQAARVLASSPRGILLAPVLQQESLAFARTCQQRSIPLICFNTYIEALPAAAFIGQNLHQSGRVAAELIMMGRTPGSVLILHIAEHAQNSAHLYAKEQGFRQYFSERGGNPEHLITLEMDNPDSSTFEQQLPLKLDSFREIEGIFITTAKAYALMPYLEKRKMTNCRIVGYDLTDRNVPYLRQGAIDVLIHQEVQKQTSLGISYLADQLVFEQEIPAIKHLPLGIVTRENLDSYLSSD